ncbi:MAG TPA: NAD(P)/FAD-dependent oxidoreductase [Roseiarcus sp.]
MTDGEVEVVIIGGGAAGVAAARRLRDAGVEALIVEARERLGGRSWTVDAGGFPVDLGCGWLHSAERNPWTKIAEAEGHTVDRNLPPWMRPSSQIGLSAAEATAFRSALERFRQRSHEFTEGEPDKPASAFLEPRGPWNPLLEAISTYYSGAELERVSARDLANYGDDGVNWRVVEGYGRTIADHGAKLPVALGCKAERIDRRGKRLTVETTKGPIVADAVIVTLPSALIAEQPELFLPALPEKTEAAAGLPLGLADKLFLTLADPSTFESESRAFGDASRAETAAYHIRPFGRPMIEVYFGGSLAAELEKGGEQAFFDFALAELVGLFGANFARRIAPLAHHGWRADPFARGSYSYASPGSVACRDALAAAVEDRIFFAGEACSRHDYSTAHGAYLTGVAAADEAIKALKKTAPSRR